MSLSELNLILGTQVLYPPSLLPLMTSNEPIDRQVLIKIRVGLFLAFLNLGPFIEIDRYKRLFQYISS